MFDSSVDNEFKLTPFSCQSRSGACLQSAFVLCVFVCMVHYTYRVRSASSSFVRGCRLEPMQQHDNKGPLIFIDCSQFIGKYQYISNDEVDGGFQVWPMVSAWLLHLGGLPGLHSTPAPFRPYRQCVHL